MHAAAPILFYILIIIAPWWLLAPVALAMPFLAHPLFLIAGGVLYDLLFAGGLFWWGTLIATVVAFAAFLVRDRLFVSEFLR